MKAILRLTLLSTALALATAMSAAKIELTAADPEKMRDVRLTSMTEEDSLEVILKQFNEHLARISKRYLEEDQTLHLHFTDIDLAGDFEMWRPFPANEVRWVKAIYIPRLEFDYKVTDKDGNVITEGSEKLSDPAFQMRIGRFNHNESTHYEQEMLADWMRKTFTKKNATKG